MALNQNKSLNLFKHVETRLGTFVESHQFVLGFKNSRLVSTWYVIELYQFVSEVLEFKTSFNMIVESYQCVSEIQEFQDKF